MFLIYIYDNILCNITVNLFAIKQFISWYLLGGGGKLSKSGLRSLRLPPGNCEAFPCLLKSREPLSGYLFIPPPD